MAGVESGQHQHVICITSIISISISVSIIRQPISVTHYHSQPWTVIGRNGSTFCVQSVSSCAATDLPTHSALVAFGSHSSIMLPPMAVLIRPMVGAGSPAASNLRVSSSAK